MGKSTSTYVNSGTMLKGVCFLVIDVDVHSHPLYFVGLAFTCTTQYALTFEDVGKDIMATLISHWPRCPLHFFSSFANAPKAVRADWNDFTKNFFVNRESLVSVLLLVDASIPPLQIDLECADWLGSNKVRLFGPSHYERSKERLGFELKIWRHAQHSH